MQIKRKLTEREQKLLQILINERNKGIQEIAQLAKTDIHDLKTIIDSAIDELDLSFLNQNKEIDCTLISAYNEKLKNIEHAIDRLAEGNYGSCQKCGQPIPEKRLEALPFALYCVNCQKKKEEKNKEATQRSYPMREEI
ncbi:MAG: TraR/DksA C4-type zinc finger protein [bacterium]|nr:TraR/DksA C4-type zinc finger protein [bacterium]